ncbi:53f022d6-453b-499c-bd49-4b8ef915a77a [Thermothielavioides terrestris]|uniref:53f022d6-453b-499c-bd49-4b8ef915a77a n=1 Tax=Thermothielavioides terrestris TaxID=2587410 RepID=A0A446BE45_9PEZI|nr:53f022d6-453b-499c-bd49-4b8ef915a77a [Thermothielavioides terrestris]
MSPHHTSHFTTPSDFTIRPPPDAAAQAAAYQALEQEEYEEAQPPGTTPPASPAPTTTTTSTTTEEALTRPLTNDELTPLAIAIKRTQAARARLATAHEGWVLAARALLLAGLLRPRPRPRARARQPSGDGAFGDAICGRYAAASFLSRVLVDMEPADWFGRGRRFDDTLRRLKTLKGLEASLVCWEEVLLRLMDFAEGLGGGAGGKEEEEGGKKQGEGVGQDREEELRRVLIRWRRGVPSRP